MKKTIYLNLILVMFITISDAHSQTCLSETEIPSTTPDSHFTDNNNGTVTDKSTGLMWQKCQLGLSGTDCTTGTATDHTWEEALDEAENNTTANFNDWRLPNHKELLSLVEERCYNPSINTNYFPNTTSSLFWSSSPSFSSDDRSWLVFFTDGTSLNLLRIVTDNVRLVRTE